MLKYLAAEQQEKRTSPITYQSFSHQRLMHNDTLLIAHTEELWAAINLFFAHFASSDWGRPHGKDWNFGDVPYHLKYFHILAADAIKHGREAAQDELVEVRTLSELTAFNKSRFAERPHNQTGAQSFNLFKRSQEILRDAIKASGDGTTPNLDRQVWFPLMRARGWHSMRFVLEYMYWHNWLHFSEAQLRLTNELPPIDADMMHRAVHFHMHEIAGAVDQRHAPQRLVWLHRLTGDGGGAWTYVIDKGWAKVADGEPADGRCDVLVEHGIDTYLKTMAFGMLSPLRAALTGQTHLKGARTVAKLARIFSPPEDQQWQPMQDIEAEDTSEQERSA